MWLPRFPSTTYWKDCLFPIVYSCLFCHRLIDHNSVGLFLAFLSFSWPVSLFLCQYHSVLITVALWYRLKSRNLFPQALFFSLKIALAIWGLLCFRISWKGCGEKRTSSYIVGGNKNWYSHYEKQYGVSLKTKIIATIWSEIPFLGIYLGKNIIQKYPCTPVFTVALFTVTKTLK